MKLFTRHKTPLPAERRMAGPRVRVDCMATLLMPSGDRPGRLFDISTGGARITVEEPPAKGVSAILNWGSQEVYCMVIWSKPGMCGVEFDKPISQAAVDKLAEEAPSGPRLVYDAGSPATDANATPQPPKRPMFGC
ncbi:hypothetical protein BMF35_a1777 [Aurantiacibacter gangjinensis]|uniref:Uncharacterized protein n=2 Tax=Aurantiacibacter gangjinensis TaxID=502682 RepID=A0A0G9MPY1_9SPHN|nr:hypothetical protein BMF35_a1777 [Aurantiacibacter gangjinensis]KLE32792.1 hypothetical protein AAW01_01780 [Aurantiacibacter gangjinensis]